MENTPNHHMNAETALRQIGAGNILATSGGRWSRDPEGRLILPVRYGYYVRVSLVCDLYTVERVFVRSGKITVKATMTGLYADQVGEAVYRAGCFRDAFGDSEAAA